MNVRSIGILGAGKVGIVLAQLARKAGYDVFIAGSGSPSKISLSVRVLAPDAKALSGIEVAERSDIIILAVPLSKYKSIPKHALANKLVIDAMNYWWEVDGARLDIIPDNTSSSIAIQQFLSESRVIKAFSHMGYHELYDEATPRGNAHRKAIAIAGDNRADIDVVATVIDAMGFDPLYIGNLAKGILLEPGYPAFGASLNKDELRSSILES